MMQKKNADQLVPVEISMYQKKLICQSVFELYFRWTIAFSDIDGILLR